MSKAKVTLNKDFEKIIEEKAKEGIKKKGIDVTCPRCGCKFHLVGEVSQCPNCSLTFKL